MPGVLSSDLFVEFVTSFRANFRNPHALKVSDLLGEITEKCVIAQGWKATDLEAVKSEAQCHSLDVLLDDFVDPVELAMEGWVGQETWHTGHWADEERFHMLVRAHWVTHGGLIDERMWRERIRVIAVAQETVLADQLQESEEEKYTSRAQHILQYLIDTRER